MRRGRFKPGSPAGVWSGAYGLPGMGEYSRLLARAALYEDIGSGDVTTDAVVPPKEKGEAVIVAKERLVVAGLFIAERVFKETDRNSIFTPSCKDGDEAKKGAVLATVSGSLRGLLTGERVALNFLQRLSGIATLTRSFVRRVEGTGARILDTRKTTPCFRILEKYAVRAGGGMNHRFGLFDSVLVKDNHIKAACGLAEALKRVDRKYGGRVLVEAEASDLDEVEEALTGGADIIMLDNMAPSRVRKALGVIRGRALVEVSGGISLRNVRDYAKLGADFISVGALTHSAPAVDISMEVVSLCGKTSRKTPRR